MLFVIISTVNYFPPLYYLHVSLCIQNDVGLLSLGQNVFTSFLKARITCTYDANDGPTYYYDNIMDTELVNTGTVNTFVMGQHLYAAFSAPVNGPDGSVLCVYTFDGEENDLDGVFSQNYLMQTGPDTWVEASNNDPVTCSNTRDLNVAKSFFLMEPSVLQIGSPLVKMDGLLFQQIVIDKVTGVNGNIYEVILIAANEEDFLRVLKMTYVYTRNDEDKIHIAQSTVVASDSNQYEDILSMELYKTQNEATVYLSTNEALYRVPIADCAKYTNCRSCIESRDPYCAYDTLLSSCVNTLSGYTVDYIQDVDNGDASNCPISPSSSVLSLPDSTSTTSILSTDIQSSSISNTIVVMTSIPECSASVDILYRTTTSVVTETIIVQAPVQSAVTSSLSTIQSSSTVSRSESSMIIATPSREPNTEGLTEQQDNNHLYMIIGIGAACFIVGTAFGVVLFACIRNKDKFIWGKMLSRNRRLNFNNDDEKCNNHYEMCNTKGDEYQKNNNGYNEFTKESTPTRASTPPLSKLTSNPTSKPSDSPVLSKYTTTGKTHNRSMSSGGRFQMPFPIIDSPARHSPVPESPVRKNIRNAFHVEEGVSNNERQKYGKNIVSKQISREYPMTFNDSTTTSTTTPYYHHSKTNSFDGWSLPTK